MDRYLIGEWIVLAISSVIILIYLWSLTRKNKTNEDETFIYPYRYSSVFDKKYQENKRKFFTQVYLKKSLAWALGGSCCFFLKLFIDYYIEPHGSIALLLVLLGFCLWVFAFRWLLRALVVNF